LKPLRSRVLKTFKIQKLSRDHAEYVGRNPIKIHPTVRPGIDNIHTDRNQLINLYIDYMVNTNLKIVLIVFCYCAQFENYYHPTIHVTLMFGMKMNNVKNMYGPRFYSMFILLPQRIVL